MGKYQEFTAFSLFMDPSTLSFLNVCKAGHISEH